MSGAGNEFCLPHAGVALAPHSHAASVTNGVREDNPGAQCSINLGITHTVSKLDIVVLLQPKHDANQKIILNRYVLLGNVVMVSKARLDKFITDLAPDEINAVDIALAKSVDLFRIIDKYGNMSTDKNKYIEKLKNMIDMKDKEITRLSNDR